MSKRSRRRRRKAKLEKKLAKLRRDERRRVRQEAKSRMVIVDLAEEWPKVAYTIIQ